MKNRNSFWCCIPNHGFCHWHTTYFRISSSGIIILEDIICAQPLSPHRYNLEQYISVMWEQILILWRNIESVTELLHNDGSPLKDQQFNSKHNFYPSKSSFSQFVFLKKKKTRQTDRQKMENLSDPFLTQYSLLNVVYWINFTSFDFFSFLHRSCGKQRVGSFESRLIAILPGLAARAECDHRESRKDNAVKTITAEGRCWWGWFWTPHNKRALTTYIFF